MVLASGLYLVAAYGAPRPYDRQYDNGRFVQDWCRDHNFVFGQIEGSIPAYVRVRTLKTTKGHHSYDVQGAALAYSKGASRYYGAQLPLKGSHLIQVTEHLLPKQKQGEEKMNIKRRWPSIVVDDPEPLYINRSGNPLPSLQKQSPGLFMGVNNDDDDQDGIPDLEDDHVPGESSMIQVSIMRPRGMPVQLSWNDSIVHLYESPQKTFISSNATYSARIGEGNNQHAYKGYDDQIIYVEGVAPGTTEITLTGPGGFSDKLKVTVLAVGIIPDWNNDRSINNADKDSSIKSELFHIWINNDNDYGDESMPGGDIPGGRVDDSPYTFPDFHSYSVDGRNDLIDFFPVWLNVHETAKALKNIPNIEFRLSNEDSSVNFVYSRLSNSRAGEYLKSESAVYSSDLESYAYEAETVSVSSQGVALSNKFIDFIISDPDGGVILIEGCRTSQTPLVLSILKDGSVLASARLQLGVNEVENMFRHVNMVDDIDSAEVQDVSVPDRKNEPCNYPDQLCSSNNFVFVHGYNVSQEEARAWHSEMFKRLYKSGSKAKFTGVTWHGDTGKNYHKAVINAMVTSQRLMDQLSFLEGSVTIGAHSLGNVLVSEAIVKNGFTPSNYLMFNAAVAIEAYDASQLVGAGNTTMRERMMHPDWVEYPDRLLASEWNTLFPGDARQKITWRNRYSSIDAVVNVFNFYSEGEDVVMNADGTIPSLIGDAWLGDGRLAWVLQELIKGLRGPLGAFAYEVTTPDQHGGWAFNTQWTEGSAHNWDRLEPEEATSISQEQLQQEPFFRRFQPSGVGEAVRFPEYDGLALLGPSGSSNANYQANKITSQYKLLAEAIPALSFAAAANRINKLGVNNINMQEHNHSWPQARQTDDWKHSDLKSIAYPYVHPLFDRITQEASLK